MTTTKTLLYHGSGYKHTQLMPGFKRSGRLEKWDKTEDNTWLYACRSAKLAIAMGIASAITHKEGIDGFHYNGSNKIIIEGAQTKDIKIFDNLEVYLYEIIKDPNDGWIPVNNKNNEAKNEYKTQHTIQQNIKFCATILVHQWLKNRTVIFK